MTSPIIKHRYDASDLESEGPGSRRTLMSSLLHHIWILCMWTVSSHIYKTWLVGRKMSFVATVFNSGRTVFFNELMMRMYQFVGRYIFVYLCVQYPFPPYQIITHSTFKDVTENTFLTCGIFQQTIKLLFHILIFKKYSRLSAYSYFGYLAGIKALRWSPKKWATCCIINAELPVLPSLHSLKSLYLSWWKG